MREYHSLTHSEEQLSQFIPNMEGYHKNAKRIYLSYILILREKVILAKE